MAGTLFDKLKIVFLLGVLSMLALSAYPNSFSYFTQASVTEQYFKANYGLCDTFKDNVVKCEDDICRSSMQQRVNHCMKIIDKAVKEEASTCSDYANKLQECRDRNVNCRVHMSNLNACRAAVDAPYAKQISLL